MNNENIKHLNRLVEELKQEYYKRVPDTSEKTVVWADKAFNNLYKLLKVKVGVNTLRKIFNGQYIITSSTQKINTLSTLCQFLGYDSWNSFLQQTVNEKTLAYFNSFTDLLISFNQALFNTYKTLPNIGLDKLKPYVYDFYFINNQINELTKYLDYSPFFDDSNSECTLLEIEVKWSSKKKLCLQTREFWKIDILHVPSGMKVNKQGLHSNGVANYIYLLVKDSENWKVGFKWNISYRTYDDDGIISRINSETNISLNGEYPIWSKEFQESRFGLESDKFIYPNIK